jgi:hypothetical protein
LIIIGGRGSNSHRISDNHFKRKEDNEWFKGSIVVDENNQPLVVYHGSLVDFDEFDVSKIRHNETDANYNGFWFSTDPNTSPAWHNANFVKSYYLSLKNPAPIKVANEVYKEIYNNPEKYNISKDNSFVDATRLQLQKMGYDGVIHQEAPKIDWGKFEKTGEYTYTSNRGTKYQIVKNEEYGSIDLNYARNGENITGYIDKADFIKMNSERIYVIFKPSQIKQTSKVKKVKP